MNLAILKMLGISQKDLQKLEEFYNELKVTKEKINKIYEFIEFKKLTCEGWQEYEIIKEKLLNNEKLDEYEKEFAEKIKPLLRGLNYGK